MDCWPSILLSNFYQYLNLIIFKMAESPSKIQVDKGGNPREGITPEDIAQAIKDIVQWLTVNVPGYSPNPPADPAFIETIPEALFALREAFGQHNGGVLLNETFSTLPSGDMTAETEVCAVSAHWQNGFYPIAKNSMGELYISKVETGADCGVLMWTHDNGVEEQVSETLASFIETTRNKLLTGKYEYIDEDLGLCENA